MRKAFSLLAMPLLLASMVLPVFAAEAPLDAGTDTMRLALYFLLAVAMVMVIASLIATFSRGKKGAQHGIIMAGLYVTTLFCILVFVFCLNRYRDFQAAPPVIADPPPVTDTKPEETPLPVPETTTPSTTSEPIVETTVPPTTEDPLLDFAPAKTVNSDPAKWKMVWEIQQNKQTVSSYTRAESISFGYGSDYFALPGIATFRGNNYRSSSTYGTANVTEGKMEIVWSRGIGGFNGWSGSGWTGQPLVVQWDEETKQIMNLYQSKKDKPGLVEVIYATLDGHIYFYDLDDGSYTRDPINMQMNYKGAGALDPRGYPLLYVGSGIYVENGKAPRMSVVSLITGKTLYEFGNGDGFAPRNWSAFDSSPLVDAETDTLIWPGENGILYTIKLNTEYDKAAGTISVSPDYPVKARYRHSTSRSRYYGYESSASIVSNYLYASENGGLFYCVDLNTMDLVWAQDTLDDSNSSPVFEWDANGNGYVYTAPSLHWTAKDGAGTINIYKLNAETGEIVWKKPVQCKTVKDLSGGVQSTPLLGKAGTEIDGMIIYSIARVPGVYSGVLTALDKQTGETIWEISTGNYAWSSPTAVYTDDGQAYVFICDASGNCKLVDGKDGTVLSTLSLGSTVEASPIVYEDMLVIGSRGGKAYGIKIS